jgi:hypothetical protein
MRGAGCAFNFQVEPNVTSEIQWSTSAPIRLILDFLSSLEIQTNDEREEKDIWDPVNELRNQRDPMNLCFGARPALLANLEVSIHILVQFPAGISSESENPPKPTVFWRYIHLIGDRPISQKWF